MIGRQHGMEVVAAVSGQSTETDGGSPGPAPDSSTGLTSPGADGTDGVERAPAPRPSSIAHTDAGRPWTPPSWEQVVRDHGPRVYRLAYRLTGNRADAEDLVQDTFVRVFRALPTYEPGTFEGWLHRITTNLFLDGARRRARIRFVPLPEDAERLVGRTPSPERTVLDAAFEPDVAAALGALSPEFRAAVVLADIEQLPYEEIARRLGVKIGTVRSRIHRGRTQLRMALAARAPRGCNELQPAA